MAILRNTTGQFITGTKIPQNIRNKISATLKGRKKTKEHVEKVRAALKGRVPSLEERRKNSEARRGRPSSFKGKKHSQESRYKMRIASIRDAEKRQILLGRPGARNFNPIACQFVDNLNKKNGWNLRHALNGGEEMLYGYFVDGYDRDRNIVFEYDEPKHNGTYWKEKDLERQIDIIKNIKPTKFIRYDEQWNNLYEVDI